MKKIFEFELGMDKRRYALMKRAGVIFLFVLKTDPLGVKYWENDSEFTDTLDTSAHTTLVFVEMTKEIERLGRSQDHEEA